MNLNSLINDSFGWTVRCENSKVWLKSISIWQAQLDGSLSNPSAADFVHIFFSSLTTVSSSQLDFDSFLHPDANSLHSLPPFFPQMVPQYPVDLPPAVVSPLLTLPALRLLSQAVSPEEDELWTTLGDSWNIPRYDGLYKPPSRSLFHETCYSPSDWLQCVICTLGLK